MRIRFIASAKQIAWRKKFGKLYGKKKKGGKSKSTPVKKVKNSRLDKHDKPKTKSWKA